jgi:two-component system nitrogen regulation response regulator NtrX
LLGSSDSIRGVRERALAAARERGRVLLIVERGFDAGAIARWIHECGEADAPFIAIDCASGEPPLVERALFGARAPRGGAHASTREVVAGDSRLAAATGGTLYLAHLDQMPAGVQARLAHVLRDGELLLDGEGTVPLDVRIVAAARPDVASEVERGTVRTDLYRRFAAGRIVVPPLRERSEDVVHLTKHFVDDVPQTPGAAPCSFTHAALASLAALPWPGNVAELRQIVDRLRAAANGRPIRAEDVLSELGFDRQGRRVTQPGTLRDARRNFEREYIAAVLGRHGWRIAEAAATLGIERANLYRKIRQIGLTRPSASEPGDHES